MTAQEDGGSYYIQWFLHDAPSFQLLLQEIESVRFSVGFHCFIYNGSNNNDNSMMWKMEVYGFGEM